jgi:hypothetical protein
MSRLRDKAGQRDVRSCRYQIRFDLRFAWAHGSIGDWNQSHHDAMNNLRKIDVRDVGTRAERALSDASGGAVKLVTLDPLSKDDRRNFIGRAAAYYDDGTVRSVIVKATRSPTYDAAAEDLLQISGLAREWIATAYIAAHAPDLGHGGALLAGDVESGILIFEDLGTGLSSLVDPLLEGTAEEAEHALALYATALARLHGDTVGCRDRHHATFQSIFGSGQPRGPLGWRVEKDVDVIAKCIGGAPPASELDLLSSRIGDPGPWLCLVHGDPCPDNALLVDGRLRLIDYEFARPSHALLDGIYWHMGFPTCWCAGRVPADVAARVDAAYRTALGNAIPLALDDRAYRTELAYVSAIWLFTSLSWRLNGALESDEKWGIWSVRGRLLWYLEAVIDMTAAAGVLPGIRQAAANWLLQLRALWPDALPLGEYPCFARQRAKTS